VAERGHEYDIIFIDHTMPLMTGTEASRQIRINGYNRHIFGVTGNALDDDVEVCRYAYIYIYMWINKNRYLYTYIYIYIYMYILPYISI
jgi:CheY-like chemotaxis protein